MSEENESMYSIIELKKIIKELEDENKELKKNIEDLINKDTTLLELCIKNGNFNAEFSGQIVELMANHFAKLLEDNKAPNYLEMYFKERLDKENPKSVVVTIKWENGKTPHQLRKQAEEERDKLKIQVEELKKEIEGMREYINIEGI